MICPLGNGIAVQSKPPLLQMYTRPSGPIAAPFGPPATFATSSWLPSGRTRVTHSFLMSTRRIVPSGMATGPSAKPSPWQTTSKVEASKMADALVMLYVFPRFDMFAHPLCGCLAQCFAIDGAPERRRGLGLFGLHRAAIMPSTGGRPLDRRLAETATAGEKWP